MECGTNTAFVFDKNTQQLKLAHNDQLSKSGLPSTDTQLQPTSTTAAPNDQL
jgi:hypothetical protein